jgi:hypothetical protein
MKNVALCFIATGKYKTFFDKVYASALKYFLPKHNRNFFVFSDSLIKKEGVTTIKIEHLPWPLPTLLRYKYMLEGKAAEGQDYVFYCDVDMLFVDYVEEELFGSITAIRHPCFPNGYDSKRDWSPYDENQPSAAFIEPALRGNYFCGGFQGGAAKKYSEAMLSMNKKILSDLNNNIIARYWDESHWNKYLADNPPDNILSSSYCYPDDFDIPFKKKILALSKNHDLFREYEIN